MAYNSKSSNEVYGYAIVKGTEDDVKLEEYEITVDRYSETEGGYDFYNEVTYTFTDKDGTVHDFQNEEELEEFLETNGYTREY